MSFTQLLLSSTALVLIAGGEVAYAQIPPLRGTVDDGAQSNSSSASPLRSSTGSPSSPASDSQSPASRTGVSPGIAWSGPEFQWHTSGLVEESYVTNAAGLPGGGQTDYLSTLSLSSDLHQHSRRITLDANYNFFADLYARGTLPTQISNNLQALGNFDAVPEYLNLDLRAFAQPIVTSNFGAISAGNREIPGAFRNVYGYTGTPHLRFRWGNFATSETMPSYGQLFFTTPPGSTPANTLPGLAGPIDTTLRSVTEILSSGSDFERLDWRLVGAFSETERQGDLLSEKSGVGRGRYALNYEWSLIFTGGYDQISDTRHLIQNASGPEALGGVGLTIGRDFSFQAEAGERYNKFSFDGGLRYDITPTSLISASASDYVQTPEGQLLNNLTNLTALPNGALTSASDVLANGAASSLMPFNIQSPDIPALDQFVSRYQIVSVSFMKEMERTRAAISMFGTRRTFLTAGFTGPPTADSWGVQLIASRNITPLLSATLGATYTRNQEFGGHASSIDAQGELSYSLSRSTQVFIQSYYITRNSSFFLSAVSPLAGSASDFRATVGIRHSFW